MLTVSAALWCYSLGLLSGGLLFLVIHGPPDDNDPDAEV